MSQLNQQFLRDGFFVARNIVPQDLIHRIQNLSERILKPQLDADYQKNHKAIGSLFDVLEEPEIVDLISWPKTISMLNSLGIPVPYFQYGIVFNKLPQTPATFWHQDCTMWNIEESYQEGPQEIILIHYLQDTTEENGCLRVIPGSHRYRHSLHDFIQSAYTPDLRKVKDPQSRAFHHYQEEISVPVQAGDIVVIDCRLLHAAFPNQTGEERTALGLFYVPFYEELPENIQARFTWDAKLNSRYPFIPEFWPTESQKKLQQILPPRYQGQLEGLAWDSKPNPEKMLDRL